MKKDGTGKMKNSGETTSGKRKTAEKRHAGKIKFFAEGTAEKRSPGKTRISGKNMKEIKAAETSSAEKAGTRIEKNAERVKDSGLERLREHWRAGNMLYPLPAVMVSCGRPGEKPNIITVAWAGTVCSSPAMVSISVRPNRYSYGILRETGEFVINLTTEELVYAADYCGVRSGRDVDKFAQLCLTAEKAVHVNAPIIAESPVNIECRVQQVLELGSHHMFIAEVLGVDVDGRYLDKNGKLHLNQAGLMVYSHGEYFGLGKMLGKFGYSVQKRR